VPICSDWRSLSDQGQGGRSKNPRLCLSYNQTPSPKLTTTAEKNACGCWAASRNHVGSGFTLASQDLDIRGAGNLLGEEANSGPDAQSEKLLSLPIHAEDAIAKNQVRAR